MKRTIRADNTRKRGVAAVEFAFCVPLFALMTVGAIQTTDAIYLKNSLRVVAYEAVRDGVKPTGTNATATARANEILSARNVRNATITFTPGDLSTATAGQPITVRVSAPADDNTIMPNWFYSGKVISDQLTMTRE